MNYYPYYGLPINTFTPTRTGLFGRLLGGRSISFSSILNGTQKVLNIANQTIPMIKQVSPIMKNAKTMFKVMNEFKKIDTPNIDSSSNKKNQNNEQIIEKNIVNNNDGPNFFI